MHIIRRKMWNCGSKSCTLDIRPSRHIKNCLCLSSKKFVHPCSTFGFCFIGRHETDRQTDEVKCVICSTAGENGEITKYRLTGLVQSVLLLMFQRRVVAVTQIDDDRSCPRCWAGAAVRAVLINLIFDMYMCVGRLDMWPWTTRVVLGGGQSTHSEVVEILNTKISTAKCLKYQMSVFKIQITKYYFNILCTI